MKHFTRAFYIGQYKSKTIPVRNVVNVVQTFCFSVLVTILDILRDPLSRDTRSLDRYILFNILFLY